MKWKYLIALLAIAAVGTLIIINRTSKYPQNKWTRLVDECGNVLNKIQGTPDEGIPAGPLLKCEAIGIFPSTVSAGLGIGGEYGQGIIMVRDRNYTRWSSPAIFTLAGGSIGWQIGGQAADIVLLFMDRQSIDALLAGKVKLGVDASIAAGPVGREASAATDIKLKGGILSYSVSRGLFIGAKLEGVVLTEHEDGNRELYGKRLSAHEILIERKAQMPRAARRLLGALNRYNPIIYLLRRAMGLR